ncbi:MULTISPECIES: phosphotransferase family protein [unclassified Nocardioides]|uniref:phosphotransferase family protein n=1 Tax=unclassified Nocardioides TaxID=2615069 RepID=UPI0030154C0A
MLARRHQVALVDPATSRVLVVDGALPRHPDRWPSFRDLAAAVGSPEAFVGGPPWRAEDGTITNVLVGASSSLPGASWVPLGSVGVPGLVESVEQWRSGYRDDGRAAWFVRGWVDPVVAWVSSHAPAPLGPPEAVKLWSLSAVLRFPVLSGGELFFKATCDGFRAEPALTAAVRALAPDATPVVLAVDPERAWMLMESLPGADDGAPASYAVEVARRLARLQLDSLPARDVLLAAGAPDRGLEATLAKLRTVLRESVDVLSAEQRARAAALEPWLAATLRALWDSPLPDTLAHGDLHLGNVARVDDRPVLFDWTDTCLTHPFLDVRHLADSAAENADDPDAARDEVWQAYAEPWRTSYPEVDLDALWARTRVANAVFQAITFEQIYRGQPLSSRWELATVVGEIVDQLAAVRDGEA